MTFVGIFSLASVFAAMFALGAGSRPFKLAADVAAFGLLARSLFIALVVVPAAAVAVVTLFDLERALLAGLLLIGISPGAPMALRRSRESGGQASFSMVLQVMVALLAIVAVPAWILLLDALYGGRHDLVLAQVARQVFLAQLLPLGCGSACAFLFPTLAARVSRPILRASGVMLVVVAVLVLWQVGPNLPRLGPLPFAASALLAAIAIVLGHLVGGPAPDTRTTSAVICALRNPGIALLVASANRMPPAVQQMIIAHVVITTLLLLVYLAVRRRLDVPGSVRA